MQLIPLTRVMIQSRAVAQPRRTAPVGVACRPFHFLSTRTQAHSRQRAPRPANLLTQSQVRVRENI